MSRVHPGHPPCPVCSGTDTRSFGLSDQKQYWRCQSCHATWLDPAHHLSAEDEYAHYLNHENEVYDPGYRTFLARLTDPLLQVLPAHSDGLDYGCGPGPALAAMLTEAGHHMATWDPFFADHRQVLDRQYDFVTCTEVLEHLRKPLETFQMFDKLLCPGGWLGLMTCFQNDDDAFAGWHYRKDPTHIVFYRAETIEQISKTLGWSCHIPRKDVALLQKPWAPPV